MKAILCQDGLRELSTQEIYIKSQRFEEIAKRKEELSKVVAGDQKSLLLFESDKSYVDSIQSKIILLEKKALNNSVF